jgi:hypothetical protein
MDQILKKGVQMHSFSDQSGCVFLDIHSGETLSILMSETEILNVLSGDTHAVRETTQTTAVQSLIHKNFILPLELKNTDV